MSDRDTVEATRKRGRPTERERVERRAQILDAALPVFLQSGFGQATVDELAAAARVSKRTIYSYFGDKAGVFAAMVQILATTVSTTAPDDDTLLSLASRIVYRLNSAELVGLHRLVIAESTRFPELAATLHGDGDLRHIARLRDHIVAERGEGAAFLARPLFSLLLGEEHRMRLLGLQPPITEPAAREHAAAALAALSLDGHVGRRPPAD